MMEQTQIERHENALLRQENDKLRADNMTIREAMRNPMCTSCGGAAVLGEVSLEEQHLRIENARLKDELDRVCALAGKFLGRPVSSGSPVSCLQGCSSLELGVGTNGFGLGGSSLQPIPDLMGAGLPAGIVGGLDGAMHGNAIDGMDRTVLLELGLAAMEELVKLSQLDEPLWISGPDGSAGFGTLNFEEYHRAFARVFGPSPAGYISEATREAGIAITSSVDLVDSLMDAVRIRAHLVETQCLLEQINDKIVNRSPTTCLNSCSLGGRRCSRASWQGRARRTSSRAAWAARAAV
jgi:homeobox-leucine zipper protein